MKLISYLQIAIGLFLPFITLLLVPNSGYDISKSYPIAFSSQSFTLPNSNVLTGGGFLCDFNSSSVKLSNCVASNTYTTEGSALTVTGQYIVENMTRNQLGAKQFQLGTLNAVLAGNIGFASISASYAFDSQIVSIFETVNAYHAAWIYQSFIYFCAVVKPGGTPSDPMKKYIENKVGSNIDCKGAGIYFICVYTSFTSASGTAASDAYYHLFEISMEKKGLQNSLRMYGIFNIYDLKLFQTEVADNMLICSITSKLSINCLPMNVPSSANCSPIIPLAKEVLSGCTKLIYNFSVAKFLGGYAVICSNGDSILIQEINLGLDPMLPLIKITVATWNIIMPNLVSIGSSKLALFYGNDVGYGGVGFHVLMVPACVSIPFETSTNNSKDLEFTLGLIADYIYEGVYVVLRSPISEGKILVIADGSEAELHKQYEAKSALRYYSSNIGGDTFQFYFQLINKEGLQSASCLAEIKVKPCYPSCKTCTDNDPDTVNDNHQCKDCLNGYYNRYDKYLNSKSNCYNDTSVGVGYFLKYDTASKRNFYFPCDASCKTCTISKEHCTECKQDFLWVFPLNETCGDETVMFDHYKDGDCLKPCYHSCGKCTGAGDATVHNCDLCKKSSTVKYYYVENGSPPKNCYTRNEYTDHYVDRDLLKPCFRNCQTCSDNVHNDNYQEQYCLTCNSGSYPFKKKVNNRVIVSCYDENDAEMPKNVYLDKSAWEYKPCHSKCKSCNGPEYRDYLFSDKNPNCIVCVNDFERDGRCVNDCKGEWWQSSRYEYLDPENEKHCVSQCPKYTVFKGKKCNVCSGANYYKEKSPDCVTDKTAHYISNIRFNVISPCYTGCAECSEGGNATSNNCISCKDEFCSFIDNQSNCNKNDQNFYYKEPPTGIDCVFMKCHSSCKTCKTGHDTSIGDFHNCIECRNNYIKHPDSKALEAVLPTGTINCVENCALNGSYWYVQVPYDYCCTEGQKCPDDQPYLIELNNQCAASCTDIIPMDPLLQLYQYNGKCNKDCPANSIGTEVDLLCHDLSNIDDLIQAIPTIITEDNMPKANHMLFGYDKKFHLCKTSKALYDECKFEALKYEFSFIDLDECFELLKKVSSLPPEAVLHVATFDIETKYLSTQVEYLVYDSAGNKLQLEYCKNLQVNSNKPIMRNDILLRANRVFDEFGYNILNSTDPFYTDICLPITSDFGTDVLIEDRFDHFYSNLSFCETGCKLLDFNLTEYRAQCQCDCNAEFDVDTPREFSVEKGNKTGKDIELGFFRCYQNALSLIIFNGNFGNYATLIVLLFQLSIFLYVGLEGLKGLKAFVTKTISSRAANPPKNVNDILESIKNENNRKQLMSQKQLNDDSNEDQFLDPFPLYSSQQFKTVVKSTNAKPRQPGSEYAKKHLRNQNYIDESQSEAFNEDINEEDNEDNEERLSNITRNEEKEDAHKEEKPDETQKETFKAEEKPNKPNSPQISEKLKTDKGEKDNQNVPDKLVIKDDITVKQQVIGVNSSIKVSEPKSSKGERLKEKNSFKRLPDDSVSSRLDKGLRGRDIAIFGDKKHKRKDSDSNLTIYEQKQAIFKQRIKKYRKMSCTGLYCYYLRKRHRSLSVLFENDVYDIRAMKLSYFFLSLSLDILFGTLLSLNSLISFLYKQKGQLPIYSMAFFGGMSALAGYFLMRFIVWLMEFKPMFKRILKDKSFDSETLTEKLKVQMHRLRLKFTVYFIFMFLTTAAVWYIATTFCGTYINTQAAWGVTIGISYGVSFLFPFLYYSLTVIWVYISIEHKSRCFYYCSKLFLKL